MSKCIKVTAERLADEMRARLNKYDPEATIFLGVDSCASTDETTCDSSKISGWYYIKRVCFEEYVSSFIVFDYCGGGCADVMSLDSGSGYFLSEDDKFAISYFAKKVMTHIHDDCIWLEVEEEEGN